MVVLPIAPRSAPAEQEQHGEQREVPPYQVGIKNTFIDICEAETPDHARKGAQTAMARMCAGPNVSFASEVFAEAEDDLGVDTATPAGYCGFQAQHYAEKDNSTQSSLSAGTGTTCTGLSIADWGATFDTSGSLFSAGRIPPPPASQAPGSVPAAVPPYAQAPGMPPYSIAVPPAMPGVASSSNSPFSAAGHSPVPAPPAYAAPITFDDQTASPPPMASPGSQGMAPSQDSGLDPDFHYAYTIKNTFVDVDDGATPMDISRASQTCQAKFSAGTEASLQFYFSSAGATPGAPTPSQVAQAPCYPPSPAGSTHAPSVASPVSAADSMLPSLGSAEHGRLAPDGQPICQPCAWFFKESGCRNAQSCRYCHLCPNGELKNRKKLKIARLRNQESPQGAEGEAVVHSTDQ